MAVKQVAPATIRELAALSSGWSILFFGVGTLESDELLNYARENLNDSEALVVVDSEAGGLVEAGMPSQTPAIGAWHGAGFMCGYEHDLQNLAAFMEECRALGA